MGALMEGSSRDGSREQGSENLGQLRMTLNLIQGNSMAGGPPVPLGGGDEATWAAAPEVE